MPQPVQLNSFALTIDVAEEISVVANNTIKIALSQCNNFWDKWGEDKEVVKLSDAVVPQLIDECFQGVLDTVVTITDPFEQAFFAMAHLSYLQPFEDVNRRVSRLAANIPLIRENLSPLSFVDVPERACIDGILGVYELNHIELLRDVFVWAYERACARYSAVRQSLGEPDPFRFHFRTLVSEIVSEIVRRNLDKKTATGFINSVTGKTCRKRIKRASSRW